MYREDWKRIEELARQAGRDPARIERTLFIFTTIDSSYEAAMKLAAAALGQRYAQDFSEMVKKYAIFGTPQQCAERMDEYRQAGAEHFILSCSGPPEKATLYPEIIAREIVPLIRRGR
jgi:alkanesulfonate monooxygenase SsuD/methylene tetrahydromethanopterin reductase-like flavin-dependent oxidoreductase (luciferase family)